MLRNVELRKLPAGTLSVVVDILEINEDWKKVMSIIPKDPFGDRYEAKYNIEHIRLIEEYAKATNQKCAEVLFDEWGTSGRTRPTLGALKDVVVEAGVYRAGDEIAFLLHEPPPARPGGGPEQNISTNVTEMLNESIVQQQISTAQANDYSNRNIYQNQSTEPIQSAYYGIESVDSADLPSLCALQSPVENKPRAQEESVSDFIKFSTELSNGVNSTVPPKEDNYYPGFQDTNAMNNLGENLKPSSSINLDSTISQDTNLIHFRYCDLEAITNDFSENPADMTQPRNSGKIGGGGFGDVFIGNHPELGLLAIKRANMQHLRYYKPEVMSRVFNSEVKYLSKFRHKNIVPILGYSVDGPAPCIICEYVSGGSLLQKIAERVLNEVQRLNIMIGTAEGLKYLHTSHWQMGSKPGVAPHGMAHSDSHNSANNFMHGDVKSANILLSQDNQPKLCDFGLAKQYEVTCEVSSPMGTSAYMAPEGLSGTITQKLDIFGYGIVLLELLTGLKPIVDQNGDKINIKMYVEETCKNNDISQLLDPVAKWSKAEDMFTLAQMCLEEQRNKRPTMSVICDILHSIQDK